MTSQQQFIESNKAAVIKGVEGTGLFPSVAMAQMIVESSWGKGKTVKDANNYFGIKADPNWTGDKKLFNTPNDAKKQNYFRVYPSVQDSVSDHTKFLQINSRYPKAGVFSATTPEEQITAIAKAGYAEAHNYASEIIKLINDYNLKALDGLQGYKAIDKGKAGIAMAKKHYMITGAITAGIIFTGYFLFINKKTRVI